MKITRKKLQDLIEKEVNQTLFELSGAEQTGDPVTAAFRYLMDAIETIKKADPETKKQAAAEAIQQAQKSAGTLASGAVEGLKAVAPALGLGVDIFQMLTKEAGPGPMSGAGPSLPSTHQSFGRSADSIDQNLQQLHEKLDMIIGMLMQQQR